MANAALPELLTADEVAQALRVTTTTVYRWAQEGRIGQIRIGSTIRFLKDDVEQLFHTDDETPEQASA
jgi:excisionase family DNA binding protein